MSAPLNLTKGFLPQIALGGADSHLYRINVSLFKYKSGVKKSVVFNLKGVSIIFIIHFIRSNVLIVFVSDFSERRYQYLYLGDAVYLVGAKNLVNLICFLTGILNIPPLLLNQYNFRLDISPSDMKF